MAKVAPDSEDPEGLELSHSRSHEGSEGGEEKSSPHSAVSASCVVVVHPPPDQQMDDKERRSEETPLQMAACTQSALPVSLRCPRCHHHVTTRTARHTEEEEQSGTCCLVFMVCLAGCCLDQTKHVTVHTCPDCGTQLGRHTCGQPP